MKNTYIFLLLLMAFGIAPIANAQEVPADINFLSTENYTSDPAGSNLNDNTYWQTNNNWTNKLFCTDTYGYQRYKKNWARSQWQTPIQATANQTITLRLDFNPSLGTVVNSTSLLRFGLISASGIPGFTVSNNLTSTIKSDDNGNYTIDFTGDGSTACVTGEKKHVVVEVSVGADANSSIFSAQLFNDNDVAISVIRTTTGIPADLYTAITGQGAYAVFAALGDALPPTNGATLLAIDISRMKVSVANTTTTWTGGIDNDWATASNWDKGVPTSSLDASIPDVNNAPIISPSTNASVNNLTITELDGINITAGGSLIVSGTSSGNVTYNRTLDTDNWYLVSSPVNGQTYDDAYVTENGIASGTGANRGIATYTTASDSWVYHQGAASATANFSAATGYSVKRSSSGGAVPFTGTLNTDNVTVSVVSGGVGGFNLLGNPYTSHINSATFLTDNTSNLVSEDIWIWNQDTENYEVKSSSHAFVLAPAQGFFVKASSDTDLTFLETNQANNGGIFQKSSKTEVKLMMNDGSANRFAKLYYLENVTKGFDNGFDGETFGGIENSVDVFTNLLEDNLDKKYQVQSLPISEIENMVIPVGVNAAAGKEITFSADALNLPTEIKVFLEDRLTNTFTRLDVINSEYRVTSTESLNGVGRFYLHTAQSVLPSEDVILNSVRIFKTDASTLKITGLPQGKTSLYLYNIIGKKMMTTTFTSNGNKEISLYKLTAGIYLAKIQTEKGVINKKIILY